MSSMEGRLSNTPAYRQPRPKGRQGTDCIAFRVTHDFHRRYKRAAVDADLNLHQLFKITFDFWEQHRDRAPVEAGVPVVARGMGAP